MKKFKTVPAMILVLAMVLSLAACGGTPAPTASPDESKTPESIPDPAVGPDGTGEELGSYRISYALLGSVWILNHFEQLAAWTFDISGDNTYNYYSADFTADKMQSSTQNAINSGVDAVVYYGAYPTLTPTVIEMFDKAEIPFVMHDMGPLPEQEEMLWASPNFVGFFSSSPYYNGYTLGEKAAEDGYTKAVAIGGHVGDPCHDARIQGFTDAFEAAGGTVLGEARCTSPTEAVQKASDILNAYPEAEVAYTPNGAYAEGVLTYMDTYNATVMIYTDDMDPDLLGYVRQGRMAGVGGSAIATVLSCALLQNWLDGHPILDEKGKAPINNDLRNIYVTSENADDFETYILLEPPITEEVLKSLLWRYNNDVSYDTYLAFCESYSLPYIMEIKGA